jgi:probable F420-dependent oxidoreductase
VKFGGPLPWAGRLSTPDDLLLCARRVEELGYDYVWGGEYLLYPKSRPAPMPGSMPLDPAQNEQELLTLFAWLAGQTSTLRFQTAMMIIAYRSPFVVAKQVATLDYLSGGRFSLGVSAGWMRDEFEIYKVPFARRGEVLDEYLEIIQALFRSGGPYEGQLYRVPESWFAPRPVQPELPIVVGGGAVEPVLRRVARHGHVWNPFGCGLSTIADTIPRLRELLVAEGRGDVVLGVQTFLPVNRDPALGPVSSKDDVMRRVARYRDGGVTDLCVYMGELGGLPDLRPSTTGVLDTATWFAEQIMPEFSEMQER